LREGTREALEDHESKARAARVSRAGMRGSGDPA
jgi:hypothetical protein